MERINWRTWSFSSEVFQKKRGGFINVWIFKNININLKFIMTSKHNLILQFPWLKRVGKKLL